MPRIVPPSYPTKGFRKVLCDLFMGPDGETWAIGRFYSVPVLFVGLAAPFVLLAKGQAFTLTDLGISLGAVAAAVWGLVSGNNHVDNPLGKPPEKPND